MTPTFSRWRFMGLLIASWSFTSMHAATPVVSSAATPPAVAQAASQKAVARGWDTTYSLRRIAAPAPDRSDLYFEACPDAPGGKCFGSLPRGGGFYTLGGAGRDCKVNAHGPWMTRGGKEAARSQTCPYEFQWLAGGGGVPFEAGLTIDNRMWSTSTTRNLYIGLHQNAVWGTEYLGGANDMTLLHAQSKTTLAARSQREDAGNPNAQARYLIGIAWHASAPGTPVTYVDIEINVGVVSPASGRTNPKWLFRCPETKGIARNDVEGALHYIYLCGADWGFSELRPGETTAYSVDWARLVTSLEDRGIIDRRLASKNYPLTILAGLEQEGRMRNEVAVSHWSLADTGSATGSATGADADSEGGTQSRSGR